MIIQQRMEPSELKHFNYLMNRMNFSESDKKYHWNLQKGFEGERQFDEALESLSENNWLILHDLTLEINNTVFQIDTLLINHETIYLFEIKNYDGNFYIENEKWYTLTQKSINNPLDQLKRSDHLLQQLLQELNINITVKPYLIFVNPSFYLYQAPINPSVIFPPQLQRFMSKLNNMNPSKITKQNVKFAEQLISMQISDYPFSRLPDYDFRQLNKGIPCNMCHSLDTKQIGAP